MQDISKIITSNRSRHLLVENELKKLKTFDAAHFRGKDHLEGNYLVFKPMNKYFMKIPNTKSILSWKSKGLPDAVIKSPTMNNKLEYIDKNMFVKLNGSCLIKQNKSTCNRKNSKHIHCL